MKIIAALAALPIAALPMQCDPAPQPAPNPPIYQTSEYGNISMNAYASCAVFEATITNGSGRDTPAIWTFYADGAQHDRIYVHDGEAETVTIYFPNGSGDHKVNVRWPGQASTYKVPTDCGL